MHFYISFQCNKSYLKVIYGIILKYPKNQIRKHDKSLSYNNVVLIKSFNNNHKNCYFPFKLDFLHIHEVQLHRE